MAVQKLPEKMLGEWIWSSSENDKDNLFRFFRREVRVEGIGVSAELWICAHSSYHLLINGRQIGYGPPPQSRERSYAECYDISFYLETGLNAIAVIVHATGLPQYSRHVKRPGLWCQVNMDNQPFVWTDAKWLSDDGDCFMENMPRRSFGNGFTENLDFNSYPHGWTMPGFAADAWRKPDIIRPLSAMEGRLEISPLPPLNCEQLDPVPPLLKGKFAKTNATTHVSFSGLPLASPGGNVCAAETYVFSQGGVNVPAVATSDSPFKIFVNTRLAAEYGAENEARRTPRLYLEKAPSETRLEVQIPLSNGWNRILVVQECRNSGMGLFLSMPGLLDDDIRFLSKTDPRAPEGWMIAGPLKMPYESVTGALNVEKISGSLYFRATKYNYNDVSTALQNHNFNATDVKPELDGLEEREYVIYDLGRLYFGLPFIELEGSKDDIVDVTLGEILEEDGVPAFDMCGRRSGQIILAGGASGFFGFEPSGIRYVMLSVRKCSDEVKISGVSFYRLSRPMDEAAVTFLDDTLNNIWRSGIKTLRNSAANSFMDSPNGYQIQSIGDAMIQSLALMYCFGNYSMSEKALREFADAQFENGMIPAVCPGNFYFNVLDFAFLWPLWLYKHYRMCGNQKLCLDLVHNLGRLLEYFATLEDPESGLITDIGSRFGLRCIIDYADIGRDGMVTGVNALYCRCLLTSADIYGIVDDPEAAAKCSARASQIAAALNETAWNGNKGLFADCVAADGKQSGGASLQTNILALYAGIPGKAEAGKIIAKLFSDKEPFIKTGKCPSPYFNYFLLDTLFSLGHAEWCVNFIKFYWGGMIEANADTFWSEFDPVAGAEVPKTSLCYGASGAVNIFIIQEIAGVRAAEPGFRKIYLNPMFSILRAAKIAFHTPPGRINLSWNTAENGDIDIQLDANFMLTVAPMLPKEILEKCTFGVGKSVSILDTTG